MISRGQFGVINGIGATFALIKNNEWLAVFSRWESQIEPHTDCSPWPCETNITLSKPSDLALPNSLFCWIENLLAEHFQWVKIGQTFSEWIEILGTALQNTMLCLMCFLWMLYGFARWLPNCKISRWQYCLPCHPRHRCHISLQRNKYGNTLVWFITNT